MHINSTPLEAVMAKDARPREWPPGEGEMARRIRAFDWASTPLGPIDTWPPSLRSSIQAMSSSACRSERLSAIDPDGSNAGEDVAEFSLADDNFDMRAYIHRLLEARHAEAEERKSTEKALRESEERLRTALQAGKMAYWTWNSAERVLVASDALVELIGLLPNQDLRGGMETFELVHPEDRKRHRELVERRGESGKGWHSTYRIVRPRDGQVAWLEERAEVSHDPATGEVRITGLTWDITGQKQTAERQKILLAELQHRTRNLLGVVRSITDRTLKRSASLQEFGASFRDRLEALARVNGLLSRLNEGDRISFSELIRTELSGLGITEGLGHAGQVSLHGPENVRLRSSTVQTLALALHELVTNALKYGALSRAEGRLSIRWSVKRPATGDRRLQVEWREEGVPVQLGANDQPERRGYGRELIERALPYQLQAETNYAITRNGVHCIISLPLSTIPEGVAHA